MRSRLQCRAEKIPTGGESSVEFECFSRSNANSVPSNDRTFTTDEAESVYDLHPLEHPRHADLRSAAVRADLNVQFDHHHQNLSKTSFDDSFRRTMPSKSGEGHCSGQSFHSAHCNQLPLSDYDRPI